MTTYAVYYMKPDNRRFFIFAEVPKDWDVTKISETHVHLMDVEANDKEAVFIHCQGEVWSPNGEARELILSKGLVHTSMSVGDIVQDKTTGEFFLVDIIGFKKLG